VNNIDVYRATRMLLTIMIFYIVKINMLFVTLTVHTIYGNDILHERGK